jgi:hypothetical protein
MPEGTQPELRVCDAAGRLVKALGVATAYRGTGEAIWDDLRGNGVASRIYFYRLTVAGRAAARKMMLIEQPHRPALLQNGHFPRQNMLPRLQPVHVDAGVEPVTQPIDGIPLELVPPRRTQVVQ